MKQLWYVLSLVFFVILFVGGAHIVSAQGLRIEPTSTTYAVAFGGVSATTSFVVTNDTAQPRIVLVQSDISDMALEPRVFSLASGKSQNVSVDFSSQIYKEGVIGIDVRSVRATATIPVAKDIFAYATDANVGIFTVYVQPDERNWSVVGLYGLRGISYTRQLIVILLILNVLVYLYRLIRIRVVARY